MANKAEQGASYVNNTAPLKEDNALFPEISPIDPTQILRPRGRVGALGKIFTGAILTAEAAAACATPGATTPDASASGYVQTAPMPSQGPEVSANGVTVTFPPTPSAEPTPSGGDDGTGNVFGPQELIRRGQGAEVLYASPPAPDPTPTPAGGGQVEVVGEIVQKPEPTPTEKPKPSDIVINPEGSLTKIPDTYAPYYFYRMSRPTVVSDPTIQPDGSVIAKVRLPGSVISAKNCKPGFNNGHPIGQVCNWKGGTFSLKIIPETWITYASGRERIGESGTTEALINIKKGDVLSLVDIDPFYNEGDPIPKDYENKNGDTMKKFQNSTGKSSTNNFTIIPSTVAIFSSQ